jgi:hypothetical protein
MMVLLLLGVVTVEAKPKYRIETWEYNGIRYYLPQQKIWIRWKSGDYPFQHKSQAEEVISNWKQTYKEKNESRKSTYFYL